MSKKQKLDLTDFLTSPLRDEETTSIITNLFNRFLSEERSVRVNGQVGHAPTAENADLESVDLDRELNALVPALYYKTGSEDRVYTFEDLVNRLSAIGVNTDNLRAMLAEQSFNFMPPISLDKFVNYSSYYWTPNPNTVPLWNPDLLPEYYVIEKPASTSVVKMPVKAATTRDIKLWAKDRTPETVTVTFSGGGETPIEFTVTGSNGTLLFRTTSTVGTEVSTPLELDSYEPGGVTAVWVLAPNFSGGYGIQDADLNNDVLFTFTITVGETMFESGDAFNIDITYVTGSNTVSFSGLPDGKGFVSNIVPDLRLMWLDNVELLVGDNVLVKDQTNPEENGVYTVTSTKWVRRLGADTEETLPNGSVVFVNGGDTQAGYTYTLTRAADNAFVMDDPVNGAQSWAMTSTIAPSPVNDWQEFNFWTHVNDLSSLPSAVQSAAVQAKRPIIEYGFNIELNSSIDSQGFPSSSGTSYEQTKSAFNQLPQFNMYRYNGTHARRTSPIFFYAEDPDFPVDVSLQRRVKTNANPDYIFSTGVEDQAGRLLFWKRGTELETVWTPGATITAPVSLGFDDTFTGAAGAYSTHIPELGTFTIVGDTTLQLSGDGHLVQGDDANRYTEVQTMLLPATGNWFAEITFELLNVDNESAQNEVDLYLYDAAGNIRGTVTLNLLAGPQNNNVITNDSSNTVIDSFALDPLTNGTHSVRCEFVFPSNQFTVKIDDVNVGTFSMSTDTFGPNFYVSLGLGEFSGIALTTTKIDRYTVSQM